MSANKRKGIYIDWITSDVLCAFLIKNFSQFKKEAEKFGHEACEARNMYDELVFEISKRLHE